MATLQKELREIPTEGETPLQSLCRRRTREEKLRDGAAGRAQRYRKSSFVRYLFDSLTESLPLQILSQLFHYLRRLRVVQLVLTLALAVGAVLVVTVVSAAVLPFLIIGTGLLAILAAMRSRRMNARMRVALAGRHLRVLFPPKGIRLHKDAYFIRHARAMAAEPGVAVIVVSPYFFSTRGLGGRGAYFTARQEGEELFLVRKHYYFFLRRAVLDVVDRDMTVIY